MNLEELDNFNFFKKINISKPKNPKVLLGFRLAAASILSLFAFSLYYTNNTLSTYNHAKITENRNDTITTAFVLQDADDKTVDIAYKITLDNILSKHYKKELYDISYMAYVLLKNPNISADNKENILNNLYLITSQLTPENELSCLKSENCSVGNTLSDLALNLNNEHATSSEKEQTRIKEAHELFNSIKKQALYELIDSKIKLPITEELNKLNQINPSSEQEIINAFKEIIKINTKLHYNEITVSAFTSRIINFYSKQYPATLGPQLRQIAYDYFSQLPKTEEYPEKIKNLQCKDEPSCDYLKYLPHLKSQKNIQESFKFLDESIQRDKQLQKEITKQLSQSKQN